MAQALKNIRVVNQARAISRESFGLSEEALQSVPAPDVAADAAGGKMPALALAGCQAGRARAATRTWASTTPYPEGNPNKN